METIILHSLHDAELQVQYDQQEFNFFILKCTCINSNFTRRFKILIEELLKYGEYDREIEETIINKT